MELKSEIIAILVVVLAGVFGIIAIEALNPGKDNTSLITTVIGFLTPTLVAFLAMLRSADTGKKVDSMHASLCEIKDTTKEIATTPFPIPDYQMNELKGLSTSATPTEVKVTIANSDGT